MSIIPKRISDLILLWQHIDAEVTAELPEWLESNDTYNSVFAETARRYVEKVPVFAEPNNKSFVIQYLHDGKDDNEPVGTTIWALARNFDIA